MSPRAALRLETLGFTRVYDYTTGLADWTANLLPTEGRSTTILAAKDAVRRDAPTCRLTEHIQDATARIASTDHNQCVVTSEDGVVLGRLRGAALKANPDALVESAMESGPTTIRPDLPLAAYVEHMQTRRVSSVIVTRSTGELIGVLYRRDAEARLRALG